MSRASCGTQFIHVVQHFEWQSTSDFAMFLANRVESPVIMTFRTIYRCKEGRTAGAPAQINTSQPTLHAHQKSFLSGDFPVTIPHFPNKHPWFCANWTNTKIDTDLHACSLSINSKVRCSNQLSLQFLLTDLSVWGLYSGPAACVFATTISTFRTLIVQSETWSIVRLQAFTVILKCLRTKDELKQQDKHDPEYVRCFRSG